MWAKFSSGSHPGNEKEADMKTMLLGAVVGAFGLGLMATSAAAVPIGGVALQKEPTSLVEKVHHRCFWHHGFWHCPRHRSRVFFGFSPFLFPPFIGVGFGFGHRHHHHWWRHHWR
jgi:hypothetical protein